MRAAFKAIGVHLGFDKRSRTRLGRAFPDASEKELDIIVSVLPYTMTSPERLWALLKAVRYVAARPVDGAFVECGVWRGGSSMAAALAFKALSDTARTLWLYDTFGGMSRPTEHDVSIKSGQAAIVKWRTLQTSPDMAAWCDASLGEVRSNVARTGYPIDRVRFVAGKVEETLRDEANVPRAISLLRLDTDWYESTRSEMEILFPRVVTGGVVILDDYGHWAGSKRAVDEYMSKEGLTYLLHHIDRSGRILVKA